MIRMAIICAAILMVMAVTLAVCSHDSELKQRGVGELCRYYRIVGEGRPGTPSCFCLRRFCSLPVIFSRETSGMVSHFGCENASPAGVGHRTSTLFSFSHLTALDQSRERLAPAENEAISVSRIEARYQPADTS
jgi:hypothetical protein